jgi:hypothetical protein
MAHIGQSEPGSVRGYQAKCYEMACFLSEAVGSCSLSEAGCHSIRVERCCQNLADFKDLFSSEIKKFVPGRDIQSVHLNDSGAISENSSR